MKVDVRPGKYVVAVSGGVDSVVLLDLLSNLSNLELVVAHFNHGIRPNARKDEKFVERLAKQLSLVYEVGQGKLGPKSSEAQARKARYKFLDDIKAKHEAEAIITAHHQDDLIETAVINILRGTGPKGLIALSSNQDIIRPLLAVPKTEILEYARSKKIAWVEDESNQDTRYLRNAVRQTLQDKLSSAQRQEIIDYIEQLRRTNQESDEIIKDLNSHLFEDSLTLKRQPFIFLPSEVANEILAAWLRRHNIDVDRPLVNRLAVAVKTGRPNTKHNIDKHHDLRLDVESAHLNDLS